MKPFDFEIIDTHCHLWELDSVKSWVTPEWEGMFRTFDPESIAVESRPLGVTGAIAIECGSSGAENEILKRFAQSDYICGYGPHIDLLSPDLDRQLSAWKSDPKCVAFRMRFEGHADPAILRNPAIIEGLRRVAEHEFIFDYLVRTHHLPDVVRIQEKVLNLRGIIEHMAKPDYLNSRDRREWEEGMAAIAKHTPLHCKVSLSPRGEQVGDLVAMQPKPGWLAAAIRPYSDFVMENFFGTERVMWGSDYPISLLTSDYAGTFNALREALGELPADTARAIFRENGRKFYGV